jgi:ATP-dependent Clp protease protease subunit
MKNVTQAFNVTQAERQLIEQMRSSMSVDDVKANLDAAGVLVPSVRDKDGTGYDIFSLLLKERIVMVDGQVEPAMAGVIIAQLKYLEALDSTAPIKMLINSPGGSVIDGFAIIDVMENIECPITTVGIGLQASMGSHILAAGDYRMMAEKASLMIHGAASRTEGKVTAQHNDLNSVDRLVEQGYANYIRHIGLTAGFWEKCDAESWFTAKQAKEMGFIHEIVPQSAATKKGLIASDSAEQYLAERAKEREDKIPGQNAQSIVLALADSRLGNDIRPELLVALSKCKEYWTPELKKAKAAKAVANDNGTAVPAAAAKKGAAPANA